MKIISEVHIKIDLIHRECLVCKYVYMYVRTWYIEHEWSWSMDRRMSSGEGPHQIYWEGERNVLVKGVGVGRNESKAKDRWCSGEHSSETVPEYQGVAQQSRIVASTQLNQQTTPKLI